MRWKFSPEARSDLRQIVRRIAMDHPRAAAQWLDKFTERARLAGRSPGSGRKVPEIDRDDTREAIIGNYRMVYRVELKTVVILAIFEGHHLLPDL
jgi:plasmid stabilization system protein ParE